MSHARPLGHGPGVAPSQPDGARAMPSCYDPLSHLKPIIGATKAHSAFAGEQMHCAVARQGPRWADAPAPKFSAETIQEGSHRARSHCPHSFKLSLIAAVAIGGGLVCIGFGFSAPLLSLDTAWQAPPAAYERRLRDDGRQTHLGWSGPLLPVHAELVAFEHDEKVFQRGG